MSNMAVLHDVVYLLLRSPKGTSISIDIKIDRSRANLFSYMDYLQDVGRFVNSRTTPYHGFRFVDNERDIKVAVTATSTLESNEHIL